MLVSSFMNSCCQKSLSHLYVFTGEDPDERRGQVLMLLAEQALRLHDYKAASVHCQELMATGEVDSGQPLSTLFMSPLRDAEWDRSLLESVGPIGKPATLCS